MTIRVLGIESSCDDTAVAIINSEHEILANVIINQNTQHMPYAGVVPEIAARAHLANIEHAMDLAFSQSGLKITDIDVIAATCGPGLIGGVIVSSMYGKALASALNKPFIAINHLEGHALIPKLTNKVSFPYLLLLASGGHCQYVSIKGLSQYKILGRTIDDAIGEAFDKVAKMMDLDFPGGPLIEQLATTGDPQRFDFPRPLYHSKNADMSFSGLKTAVSLAIKQLTSLSDQDKSDIAASFQRTVGEILVHKTCVAMDLYESDLGHDLAKKYFVISGGVGANMYLKKQLEDCCNKRQYIFAAPPGKLCTDNAVMISFAGLLRFQNAIVNDVSFRPRPKWGLEDL